MKPALRWGEAPGAWWALLACTATVVLGAGTRSSFGAFLRPIEEDLDVDRWTTSLAGTFMQVGYGLSLPLLGYLAARFGTRSVMIFGTVLMAGGGVGMAAVQEPLGLYLFGGLLPGLGFAAASHIVAAVLLARWFKARLGLATGIMSSAVPGGQAIFVPFAVALIPLLGWRSTYLLLSLLIGFRVASRVGQTVRSVAHIAEGLAEGDLTRTSGVRSEDEIGQKLVRHAPTVVRRNAKREPQPLGSRRQYALAQTTRCALGLPVNGHVPGSLLSSGMQRTVTDRSSLIFFSSSISPLKCVMAKPPWIGVGLPSSSRSVVKNA